MRRRRSARAPLYRSPAFRKLAESLGANVLRLRKARGWTQEQAAERCEIAPRMLQAIEASEGNATLVTLARLASGFEVDAAQLVGSRRLR